MVDIKEIRKLSDTDLKTKIRETKEELFTKRMQQANGTLEKPTELRTLRKNVAKMKTILKERELDGGNK
ncbi:MAG: 50S ribosomal protein L29 [Firmicutes bacterium]|nr:50S ribosomal protein L29 [Bacillota bacterium]